MSEVGARRLTRLRLAQRLVAFLTLAAGLGAAAGVAWWSLVPLSTYRVSSSGGASTTERGLAEIVAGDAWFCALGLVVGLALGIVAWQRFGTIGWGLVPVVLVCAVIAALLCWWVGSQLGPHDFPSRLAAATTGDLVPVDLTLRAPVSLVTWPFFAIVPVLLGSSLGRDDEEPRPLFARRRPAG